VSLTTTAKDAKSASARPILFLDYSRSEAWEADLHSLAEANFRTHYCRDLGEARHILAQHDIAVGVLKIVGQPAPEQLSEIELLSDLPTSMRFVAVVDSDTAQCPALANLAKIGTVYDFHTIPVPSGNLIFSLGQLFGVTGLVSSAAIDEPVLDEPYMVGTSPAISSVYRAIRKFSEVDVPVLITGESGTGKELVARAIHERSAYKDGPFVAINCAGLPETLIHAELFGHEKGAFTGAHRRNIGRLESAMGGTCFLDEIGDLPLDLQGNLLRFLQEGTIVRVGGSQEIGVRARVIAATNVDLVQARKKHRFRDDLYYRLNVLKIHLPPLRERGDDIELVAKFFLFKFSKELKIPIKGFREGALKSMRRHDWAGNIRELISAVRRAVVIAESQWISAADLGFVEASRVVEGKLPTLSQARIELEAKLVREALDRAGRSVQLAATELGISRVHLYRLMQKHMIGAYQPVEDVDFIQSTG